MPMIFPLEDLPCGFAFLYSLIIAVFVFTRFVKVGERASGLLLLAFSRQSHEAFCHASGCALRFLCLAALLSYLPSLELLSRFSLMNLIRASC